MIEIMPFDDGASLHNVGRLITDLKPRRNMFVDTLMNRIAFTIITSKVWDNPYAPVFNRGRLEFGESIEEAFVDLARPFDFNPDRAEKTLFRREFPDVRVTFYRLNWQKFYKQTVSYEQLRTAFLSWAGVSDLVSGIIRAMYKSMSYDRFIATKYVLCRAILNGAAGGIKVEGFTSASEQGELMGTIRGLSNDLTFLKPDYNAAGVYNDTSRGQQYLFMDTFLSGKIDVNVLAAAFHMDKADFAGHLLLIDGFDRHDTARLNLLFGDDENYVPFTAAELTTLSGIGAVLVDRLFISIWDILQEMDEVRNGEGLYWNYVLHNWACIAVNPFANAVVITKDTFTVTDLTIVYADGEDLPQELTIAKGGSIELTAEVDGTGTFNRAVRWELTGAQESGTYIMGGTLRVATNETATKLTIKAVSLSDSTVEDSVTITVQ